MRRSVALVAVLLVLVGEVWGAADYSNSTIEILNFIAQGGELIAELTPEEGEVYYIDLDGRSWGVLDEGSEEVLAALSELESIAGDASVVYAVYSDGRLEVALKYADGGIRRFTRTAPAALAKIKEVLGAKPGNVLLGIPPNSGHEWTVYLTDDGRVVLLALGNDCIGTGKSGNLYAEVAELPRWRVYLSSGSFGAAVLAKGGGAIATESFASLAVKRANEEVYSTAFVSGGAASYADASSGVGDAFAEAYRQLAGDSSVVVLALGNDINGTGHSGNLYSAKEDGGEPAEACTLQRAEGVEASFTPYVNESGFAAAVAPLALDVLLGRGSLVLMSDFWGSQPPGVGVLFALGSDVAGTGQSGELQAAAPVDNASAVLLALSDDCIGTGQGGNLQAKCPVLLSSELEGSVLLSPGLAEHKKLLLAGASGGGVRLFALGSDAIGTGREGNLFSAFPVPVEALLAGKAVFLPASLELNTSFAVDWQNGVRLLALGDDCIGTGQSGELYMLVLTPRFLREAPPGVLVLSAEGAEQQVTEAVPRPRPPGPEPPPARVCGPTLALLFALAPLLWRRKFY